LKADGVEGMVKVKPFGEVKIDAKNRRQFLMVATYISILSLSYLKESIIFVR